MRKLFKERKLFKGGNYMRKYGTCSLLIILDGIYSNSTEFSSMPIGFNLNGYLSIAIDAMPSN